MKFYVTGGAGFIGSHLVDALAELGDVVVVDNLVLGKKKFIQEHIDSGKVEFHELDLVNLSDVTKTMKGCDVVFHMAANSDIIKGTENTKVDFDNGTLATYNVLEAMRINNVKEIVFASTSAIYGEVSVNSVKEDYGPLLPISLYGASKLACEGLISAFSDNFKIKSWIFRFANIVGPRGTHGAIFDFIHKLKKNSEELPVLGDGSQEKSYLHVLDCVNGMVHGWQNSKDQLNYFNLGNGQTTNVKKIAETLLDEMKLKANIRYSGGNRGWVGDVPKISLDVEKITSLGWKAELGSDEAVRKACQELVAEYF